MMSFDKFINFIFFFFLLLTHFKIFLVDGKVQSLLVYFVEAKTLLVFLGQFIDDNPDLTGQPTVLGFKKKKNPQ